MRHFKHIMANAVAQQGSAAEVERRLCQYWPTPLTEAELVVLDDQVALAAIAKTIFSAGFSWKVVELKWGEILQAMDGLDPYAVAMWPDERLDSLMNDTRVIRHYTKLSAIRSNAQWLLELVEAHGSVGQFLAPYQQTKKGQLIELFWLFKREGAHLGGKSGSLALRRMGVDSFVLTPDVIRALQREDVLDPKATNEANTKRGQLAAQQAFYDWQQQSGRTYQDISRILALTVAS